MDAITLLKERSSWPKLKTPAPSSVDLSTMFECAMRAPDHANLRPWHYKVYQSEKALKTLGELFLQSKIDDHIEITETESEKTRNLPLRAPMVIIAVAKFNEHPKVPFVEQVAATACGVHSLLLSAQALGYYGYWRTGALAQSLSLKKHLELDPKDEIVGFLYLGSADGEVRAKKKLAVEDFVEFYS